MKYQVYEVCLGALLCFLMTGLTTTVLADQRLGHNIYAGLLKKYVKDGVVNYQGFEDEKTVLDKYLKILEEVDSTILSRKEQFAFYINAYNAWTIKLILSAYPDVKSIKDLGSLFKSPWKKKICRIDGKVVTLDHIEHNILRPRFKDPRVHFAINCAAKSCPPLRSEPYTGDALDQQLEEMASLFINDVKSNRLTDNTLHVSSIFKWFKEDFNNDIAGFFLKYESVYLKARMEENREKVKVRYLDYDWSLNGR